MRAYAEHSNTTTNEPAAVPDFDSLWRRFHRPLTYFVTNQLSCSADRAVQVDDAVQEIMLKAYRGLERLDPGRSLAAWIYSIARNHCRDLARRSRTRERHSTGLPRPDLVANETDTPERYVLTQELFTTIDEFVESLEADDRTILLLRYYEELPYAEVAAVTDRPEGTVRYRVHEIRNRLREHLEARS